MIRNKVIGSTSNSWHYGSRSHDAVERATKRSHDRYNNFHTLQIHSGVLIANFSTTPQTPIVQSPLRLHNRRIWYSYARRLRLYVIIMKNKQLNTLKICPFDKIRIGFSPWLYQSPQAVKNKVSTGGCRWCSRMSTEYFVEHWKMKKTKKLRVREWERKIIQVRPTGEKRVPTIRRCWFDKESWSEHGSRFAY